MQSILTLLMAGAVLYFLVGLTTHVLLVARLRFRKLRYLDPSLQYSDDEKKSGAKALKRIIIGAALWALFLGLLKLIGAK